MAGTTISHWQSFRVQRIKMVNEKNPVPFSMLNNCQLSSMTFWNFVSFSPFLAHISLISYHITLESKNVVFTRTESVFAAFQLVKTSVLLFFYVLAGDLGISVLSSALRILPVVLWFGHRKSPLSSHFVVVCARKCGYSHGSRSY
ncbi:hypothetical protein ARMSODRAFT_31966 [Armillaria solidipes]|uniref:Uncharacterized protein n=1 Tax=Armillaria solidipes TaxID=1076256 RepID=A0A2H3C5A4_9AGAR|nr:hypothetical protein ARMSODRAFT_31966 [Armillaria solidipes]